MHVDHLMIRLTGITIVLGLTAVLVPVYFGAPIIIGALIGGFLPKLD